MALAGIEFRPLRRFQITCCDEYDVTARMLVNEIGHIVDAFPETDPDAILLAVMLVEFVDCDRFEFFVEISVLLGQFILVHLFG